MSPSVRTSRTSDARTCAEPRSLAIGCHRWAASSQTWLPRPRPSRSRPVPTRAPPVISPGATGGARRDGDLEPLPEVTVCSQVDSSHHVANEVLALRFGLDTFGDTTNDGVGRPLTHAQTIRN